MFKFDEWWLPDGETVLPDAMTKMNVRVDGRLTFQHHKYAAAILLCKERRRAVDVGAHVGLWSYFIAKDFKTLEAFEPVKAHRDCWKKNVLAVNSALHAFALGADSRKIAIISPKGSSGGSHVGEGKGGVNQRNLDSFDFTDVDFLKIDCEGYEPAVIEGAKETIKRCHPVVVVEQSARGRQGEYGYNQTAAVDMLQALGGSVRTMLGTDAIVEFV